MWHETLLKADFILHRIHVFVHKGLETLRQRIISSASSICGKCLEPGDFRMYLGEGCSVVQTVQLSFCMVVEGAKLTPRKLGFLEASRNLLRLALNQIYSRISILGEVLRVIAGDVCAKVYLFNRPELATLWRRSSGSGMSWIISHIWHIQLLSSLPVRSIVNRAAKPAYRQK
jgi:hypothetical protein